ncbi:MAG: DUF1697 domain-containing protein [Candidatus Solibacter sp.]
MSTYVALLRAVNVGGNNLLPMKELPGLCEQAGCKRVRTYIQSGNLIFESAASKAPKLGMAIAKAIEARFGFCPAVIVRTADELAAIIRGNPFVADGAPEKDLYVAFLRDLPDAASVAALDPDRSPGDTFHVIGREIYVRCPNGVGSTKLTNAWFDRGLATVSTGRNWRTICKLWEMAQG